jgi:hypothetical protein
MKLKSTQIKEKIATKKGEPRINPTTTKYILTQKYVYNRKAIDIYRDLNDKCSYGYVKAVIKNPVAYVGQEYYDKFLKILANLHA